MGKYTRKPKPSGDVSPAAALGVRTRAKTLALQRLQSAQPDYLELRSRRLEKPPLLWQYLENSRKAAARKRDLDGENSRIGSSSEKSPIGEAEEKDGEEEQQLEVGDLEIEVSLGENNLDVEVRERSTRETTPCSLIRSTDNITPPGSSTKQRSPSENRRVQNVFRNTPTTHEIEEFFTQAEQLQQDQFIKKYNFDIRNDLPLPGRYEWVKVIP
ncbi:cyclin-dependent kinase inhibitor 4-like [Andrographis paniculata]|uniref:cyclin-dependent kinase inhibitor 4-like n=1 Tax=Andrographis paniculata TaxID=175694 RepID=UPI0021E84E4E|nr:cyclin-dependent kinase inhibitor 4-like [Andrographis paniculata]